MTSELCLHSSKIFLKVTWTLEFEKVKGERGGEIGRCQRLDGKWLITVDRRATGPVTVSLLIFDEPTNYSKTQWLCAFLVGATWVCSGNNIFVLMLVKEVKKYITEHRKVHISMYFNHHIAVFYFNHVCFQET